MQFKVVARAPHPTQAAANKHFWRFVNVNDDEAELQLYGYISEESWWDDDVTPKQFREELAKHQNKKNITVRINSGGGDVFAANAIYTSLKDHPANIHVKIDGIAASAATIVAMAGDKISIPANAYMMIHNPMLVLWGMYGAEDMEKMAETLETIRDGIVNAYMARTGKDRKALEKLMDAETWMTGEEAVAEGFADELMFVEGEPQNAAPVMNGNLLVVNSIPHDLSIYKNRPKIAPPAGQKPASNTTTPKPEEVKNTMTLDELRAQHPDLVNQIETAASAAGATAERQRIQAIDELAGTVDAALIADAKFKNTQATANTVALQAVKEGKFLNKGYVKAIEDDADDSNANLVPGAAGDPTDGKNKGAQDKAALDRVGELAKNALNGYRPQR